MSRCDTTTAAPAHGLWPRGGPFGLPMLFQAMGGALAAPFTAPMTVDESKAAYTIVIDVPGVKQDDITVDVTDRLVTVRGTRRTAGGGEGTFERSFRLPPNADTSGDAMTATLEDGVLTLRAPKKLVGVAAVVAARAIPVVPRGTAKAAAAAAPAAAEVTAPAAASAPSPVLMRAAMNSAVKKGEVEVKQEGDAVTYSFKK